MKRKILSAIAILICLSSYAQEAKEQNCNCENTFEWAKKTVEENDAGFAFALEQKGEDLYQKHNSEFREKAKSVTSVPECAKLLDLWLKFFRKGHFGFYESMENSTPKNASNEDIIKQFAKWETYHYDKKKFYKHIDNLQDAGIEGVWQQGIYTIGIVKQNATEYTGFIIEADGVYWRQGQVKLKIDTKKANENTSYFMRDHSEELRNTKLLCNNYLGVGDATFKRIYPIFPPDSMESYFKSLNAVIPYVERVSENTLLLRIPTFGGECTEIDSIIDANKALITSTENLIIDIRNNGGGNDGNYQSTLSLLYTNPIRIIGLEYLSTKLNNQRMREFSESEDDEEGRAFFKNWYDTLENHLGEFVNLRKELVFMNDFDTVYALPKNVGIIINENNASAAESFILEARQSKKVKLFGVNTFGAIDMSNMYLVDSPCKQYKLAYSLTKRLWVPDLKFDDVGVQPDYYIDKSIPKHKWVDFVRDVLEDKK